MTTLKSCNLEDENQPIKIDAVLDKELRVVPGMLPVNFRFPHIISFSSELSSGVITVRSIYDNVVLDDSGTSEENRKATTGVES